jgi:SAM-dependent methyltransferase
MRIQLSRRIDAFDVSRASLEEARREAEREGLSGLDFAAGDFDDPRIERGRYDVALFHASLHHVSHLGRLFRRLTSALRPGALVYVDEYVGPSRHEWNLRRLESAQSMLDAAPAAARIQERIDPPIELADPSEAVRSSEIRAFLRMFLDVVQWRPYGGQLAGLVVPHVDPTWLRTAEGIRYLEMLLEAEDSQMRDHPEASNHLVAVGRIRPWPRNLTAIGRHALHELTRRRSGAVAEMAQARAASRVAIHSHPK